MELVRRRYVCGLSVQDADGQWSSAERPVLRDKLRASVLSTGPLPISLVLREQLHGRKGRGARHSRRRWRGSRLRVLKGACVGAFAETQQHRQYCVGINAHNFVGIAVKNR